MSDIILSQIEALNAYLKEHCQQAKDLQEEVAERIAERQALIEALFSPDNLEWANDNKPKLEVLKQELSAIEALYSDERDKIKSAIQKQKRVEKGIKAYKNVL